ncbi:MAG: daptide-type RiPP biosynthesis dehydogenase [Microbacterium sp.]
MDIASAVPDREARVVGLDPAEVDVETVRALAAGVRDERPELIVAIGGGTIIDAAKLSSLAMAQTPLLPYAIERAERSALTFLPPGGAPVSEFAAVPTTLGTSSETNGVAILKNGFGYRLIVGQQLRGHHAILDAENYLSLSDAAVREGCLEALLRTAGASTSPRGSSRARADSVAIARALVHAGSQGSYGPAQRLRIARLSAATQRTAALRGRDPYSARHWYVANELSYHHGVRKMVATAAIISSLWARVEAGDQRWGDASSLRCFWGAVAMNAGLPETPSEGIAVLISRWEIDRALPPSIQVRNEVARAVERSWGSRLPMLRGITTDDVRLLLDRSYGQGEEVRRND